MMLKCNKESYVQNVCCNVCVCCDIERVWGWFRRVKKREKRTSGYVERQSYELRFDSSKRDAIDILVKTSCKRLVQRSEKKGGRKLVHSLQKFLK